MNYCLIENGVLVCLIVNGERVSFESAAAELARFRNEAGKPEAPKPTRDERQRTVSDWCAKAFGADHAASLPQRGIRHIEEAIEAGQAAGCDPAMIHKLVDYVFSKEPGKLHQEIGGSGLTLLALAQAAGLSADAEEAREVERVLAKPLEHFAARNKVKNDAGFNVSSKPPYTVTDSGRLEVDTNSLVYASLEEAPECPTCGGTGTYTTWTSSFENPVISRTCFKCHGTGSATGEAR